MPFRVYVTESSGDLTGVSVDGPTAVVIAGTDTQTSGGHVKMPVGDLVAVHSEAEATKEFGDAGSLIEAWYGLDHQQSGVVVGTRIDDALTGANRITGAENAVDVMEDCESETGYRPVGISAPLETVTITGSQPTDVANGVTTHLESTAEKLNCVFAADAAWDASAAVKGATAIAWAGNNGGARGIRCYPRMKYAGRNAVGSLAVGALGVMIRNDAELSNGIAQSIGNRPLRGASFNDAVVPDIDSVDSGGNATSLLGRLTAAGLTTAVRRDGRLILEGGRLPVTTNPAYSFVGGRRAVDEAKRIAAVVDKPDSRASCGAWDDRLRSDADSAWLGVAGSAIDTGECKHRRG